MSRSMLSARIAHWLGKPYRLWLSVRSYRWARAELATVKAALPTEGVETRARRPDVLAPKGRRGVELALSRVSPTCLERALVLQAWMSASGKGPDVVVAVRAGQRAVEAHAWVEGADDWYDASYDEIHRLRFVAD